MKIYKFDSVIVGGGLAGVRAAVEIASNGYKACILTLLDKLIRSHSNAAQGGIQASLANTTEGAKDDWRAHAYDTIRGSDWLADQDIIEEVVKLAPFLIRQMDYWGAVFSRTDDGLINQRHFGGASYPRCAFASDGTGHVLMNLIESRAAFLKIPIFSRRQTLSLILDGDRVIGATALNLVNGEIEAFLGNTVVLATGGAGLLYKETTNARTCFGDGMAIALETGLAPIGNPEFVQFHPTPMPPPYILATEGCRGDGGVLLNRDGKEFMWDYSSTKGNLASRDVVSRSMMREIAAGRGINGFGTEHLWLDIKRLGYEHITTRLRDVYFLCRNFIGIDPTQEYIPVRPAQHYTMFGIKTNKYCQAYGIQDLYAIGECACWDLHGANRLGGNSLLETVASGYIAGQKILENLMKSNNDFCQDDLAKQEIKYQEIRIKNILGKKDGESVYRLFSEMREIVARKAGIFRSGQDTELGIAALKMIFERSVNVAVDCKIIGPNLELQLALRFSGMVKIALCVMKSAFLRTESRGSHWRDDYPQRDDKNWLKRTLAYFPVGAAEPTIEYEPVKITLLPPGDRGYGEKK